jgi:hypothetical protein
MVDSLVTINALPDDAFFLIFSFYRELSAPCSPPMGMAQACACLQAMATSHIRIAAPLETETRYNWAAA